MALPLYSAMLLSAALTIAVISDLRYHKIPNWLTGAIFISGFGMNTFALGILGTASSIGGMWIGLLSFLPFYVKKTMGAGDVKLMTAIGTVVGVQLAIFSVCYTLIFGGLIAVLFLLSKGKLKTFLLRYINIIGLFIGTKEILYIPPREGDPARQKFPYAIAIAIGTLTSLYLYG